MTRKLLPPLVAALALALTDRASVRAFPALASTPSDSAELAKLMLRQSLLSPSGKLTLSPEIIIPEPTDPTALLLQTSEVQSLSETLRTKAKANAAFISGKVGSLRTICAEQEAARGNFPGPVPVVYCDASSSSTSGSAGEFLSGEALAEIADAGACGILLPLNSGAELGSPSDAAAAASDSGFVEAYKAALGAGLQPLPEAAVPEATAGEWGEEEVEALVEALTEGTGEEPVGVVISVISPEEDDAADEEEGGEEAEAAAAAAMAALPSVSKPLSKRIPILGSVRTPAGGGRIGARVASLKGSGFTGAVLRCECVPGYRMNPDLGVVGGFWSAAISDLKSTRSKSFGFRAKVATPGLEKDVPAEWMKYQKAVMESGALGEMGGPPEGLDTEAGDYVGF